jgi:ACS family hexuronate transporter-like MFS transporter
MKKLPMTYPHATLQAAASGNYRWKICALLFLATTINYMDRSVLGVLAPTLQYHVFHWSDKDYATINIAFKVAYAIGLLTMGALIDRFGTKMGYTLAISIWSIAGMLHAAVRPAFGQLGFALARFGLGLGESGNFPAAIKTVGEWFPKSERALATGIFNAGSNIGAVLAPTIVPLVVLPDGTHWQYAFLTTGIFSAVWVVLWLTLYKRPETHPRLSKAELDYIHSDSAIETGTENLPWRRVLPLRETWAFAIAKITDAAWWFYLFWAGKFLYDQFGLNIKSLALPLITIYLLADIGSVGGGWLSSHFIRRGWSINRARKTTLLVCSVCILPVMFATQIGTRFQINARFFERFQKAAIPAEQAKRGAGSDAKPIDQHSARAETLEALRALEGQSFGSAKEFLRAVRGAVGPERIDPFEAVLISSARSDDRYWLAVLLIALAAASHQAWSANIFTLVSDVFPKRAVASVVGIGGMVGAVAGLVADFSLGQVLSSSGPSGYFFAFLLAGSCYPVLLGLVHLLMPRMTPLDENLRLIGN